MTKTRKVFVSLLALVGFGLVGCKGGNDGNKESANTTPSASNTATDKNTGSEKNNDSTASNFDENQNITPYTRDTNSGTREGFREKIGLKDAAKDDEKLKTTVQQAASNGDRVTSLSKNEYGIGYFSFDTKADAESKGLKLLNYEGVTPSEDTILGGQYKLARNFNYCFAEETDATKKRIVKGFVTYRTKSQEGLTIVKQNGGIVKISATTPKWADLVKNDPDLSKINEDHTNVTINFGGSTSVEKIAKALSTGFRKLAGNFVANHNHTGSGDAYVKTQGDKKGQLDIAFASREFKLTDSEKLKEGTYGKICVDGIVVGVHKENPIANITAEQLKNIYSSEGTISKWSDISAK